MYGSRLLSNPFQNVEYFVQIGCFYIIVCYSIMPTVSNFCPQSIQIEFVVSLHGVYVRAGGDVSFACSSLSSFN